MSITSASPSDVPSRATVHRESTPGRPRVTFGRVLASEGTKLVTLRSSFVMAIVLVAMSVGLTVLVAWTSSMSQETIDSATASDVTSSTIAVSVGFGQLVIAVLAILLVTGEYTTRTIQTTFAAVPKRLPVLAAKGILVVAVTVVLSLVSSIAAWLSSAPFLSRVGLSAPPTDPKVLGSMLYCAAYLVIVAVFAAAVAALVRHSAAAIAIVLGVIFVLPLIGAVISLGGVSPAGYFLGQAADVLTRGIYEPRSRVDVVQNAVVTALWLIVPAVAAGWATKRRDV